MSWRYLAYRLNGDGTEELIHPNLPLGGVRVLRTLSAANLISGTIAPEVLSLKAADGRPVLEEWSTAIYAEQSGHLRAGGILTEVDMNGSELGVVASGFMDYPSGQGWTDADASFYDADPAVLFRYAWTKLQAHAGSNLGVEVDALTTPARVGKRAQGDPNNGGTSDDPFVFARYHTTDLGKDLEELLSAASIEATETHSWDGDRVRHQIKLAYPSTGRRVDYRFVVGENVLEVPRVRPNASLYASEVVVVGAGDGPAAVVGTAQTATLKRLRRVLALSRQDLANSTLVASTAARELRKREAIHDDVDEFVVRDTPYAPVAAVNPGDEIKVTGFAGWAGTMDASFRVTSIEHTPDENSSALFKVQPLERAY